MSRVWAAASKMGSEWPRFPESVTSGSSHTLSEGYDGNWRWLARQVKVMLVSPLIAGVRHEYGYRSIYTQRHRPMSSASLLVEPVCKFDKLSECCRGSMRNHNVADMLNAVASAVRSASGPGTASGSAAASGSGDASGRVLFIGEMTNDEFGVDARVTQVPWYRLQVYADVLCRPFDFVVVAGNMLGFDARGESLDLVVDMVNAIGAPVLWYGPRDDVDAVTVFHYH